MPPHSRGGQPDIEHPGAGTLFVHGQSYASSSKRSSLIGARSRSRTPVRLRPSSNSRSRERNAERFAKYPPDWQDVTVAKEEVITLAPTAADVLLSRGVGDYTFISAPEGLLGRGKFSTVYKVLGQDAKHYALKHTPLYPHHPLIAARLLREPTLLAQLPAHPCLVGVEGWIRTEGHFYLIEKYAATHIPLNTHPLPLRPSRAAYILDQLVSVIRDCMHRGRVCHRDLKGENILVDTETGDIVVLDLGLATQFSASEPKLTTCCGSPAFHSPEIVNALNHPPGAITYFGPELDIWCIALTLLALLSASRFPLGPSHRSRHTMASRVLDRLQELDKAYPPHRPAMNWALSASEHEVEAKEWARVRRGLKTFLEMDGRKRMEGFKRFQFGQKFTERLEGWTADKAAEGERADSKEDGTSGGFKQLSFLHTEVKYTLPLSILPPPHRTEDQSQSTPPKRIDGSPGAKGFMPTPAELILANPLHESDRRVLSYIKYLIRTHGILYHCIATSSLPLLQLVIPLPPPDVAKTPAEPEEKSSAPWITALFRRSKSNARSASVPPNPSQTRPDPSIDAPSRATNPNTPITYLRCYLQIEFTHPVRDRPLAKRTQSKSVAGVSSSHTPRNSTRPRRASVTQSQPQSRSASLAPTFLSRASVRNGAVSPPTPPVTAAIGGEESLAVASLQQALLRITEVSPPLSKFEEEAGGGGAGWWSARTSPRLGTGPLPGLQVHIDRDGPERPEPPTGIDSIDPSLRSGDSGNTSPVISTPTTPSPATFIPLPTTDPSELGQSKSAPRPAYQRATTSPKLHTAALGPMTTVSSAAYRGLQPVSPSVALTPLPISHPHPLSPLSRQVSLTGLAELRTSLAGDDKGQPIPSGTSASAAPSQRRTASRPSSRLNSRAPSRSASVASSTLNSVSTNPLAQAFSPAIPDGVAKPKRAPYSRANSTLSSPVSSSHTTETNSPNENDDETPPTPRAISYVFVRLSDSRALPVLRKALDQAHDHPVPSTPRYTYADLPPAGLREPTTISAGGRADRRRKTSADDRVEEEEEERGRPRSREEPRSIGLGLSGSIGDGHGHERNGADGDHVDVKAASKDPKKAKREASASRKVFGLLGLGGGLGVGVAAVEEGERRRGSVRTTSAPPVS